MNRIVASLFFMACLQVCTGCSSLGLSLWPSQLPMLSKAKEFANRSPLPSGLEHELAKQPLPEYFVEPGDRLLIEPVELDSEFQATGDQEVMVDGSVDLARFGRIRVAGLTVEQIEAAIVDQIKTVSGNRVNINVQLLETNGAQVYVLGAVGSPGAYGIDGNETVLDCILMAGGLTSKASPCDIILVRPTDVCDCRVVQRVCYRQITQMGDVTTNYQIQPGDRVVVGERTLREELAFWKQASACPCCDRSKCVECRPETKAYRNRFPSWLPAFPMPSTKKEDPSSGNKAPVGAEGTQPAEPGTDAAAKPLENGQQPTTDKDIFLPPALPGDSPADPTPRDTVVPPVSAAPTIRFR